MPKNASARAATLHEKLVAACRDMRRAEHRVAVLLAQLEAERVFRELGFASWLDYATQALELTPRKARDLLQIGRSLARLPALDRAFSEGRLTRTKARELLRVATPETEAEWVERACERSSRDLEREVAASRIGDPPPTHVGDGKGPERLRLVLEGSAVDVQVIRDALAATRAATGARREDVDDTVLLAEICRRTLEALANDDAAPPSAERYRVVVEHCPSCRATSGVDHPVDEAVAAEARCDAELVDLRDGPTRGRASRRIPAARRRAVLHRDGYRCRVPGCSNRLWVDLHHLRARALGGGHDEDNLCTLCSVHHRMVHDGRLDIEDRGGALVFSFPDGRVIAVPLDRRQRRPPAAARAPPTARRAAESA